MAGDSQLSQLRSAAEARDLDALERAAGELGADSGAPPAQLLELCDLLSSADLGNRDRQSRIEYALALTALEGASRPDLETELRLLQHLRPAVVAAAEATAGNGRDWSAERRRVARLWLRGWQQLEAELDEPTDVPQLGLAPPGDLTLSSGAAPEQIADPELRERYEAALAANREAGERAARSQRLRLLAGPFRREAEALLSGAHGAPPFPPDELRDLLADHVSDPQTRERILAAASARSRT